MIRGTGIDIIRIERIKNLGIRWGDRFFNRIFTPGEVEYCCKRKHSYQHFAGRFAAKEAVIKVLACRLEKVSWMDIEVANDEDGKPVVKLKGGARRIAAEQGIDIIHISITHEKEYALAQAIGEEVNQGDCIKT